MSKLEEIQAIQNEIKTKERQIYQANKEVNAWNKGMVKSQTNTKMSRLFIETQREEISALQAKLMKLKAEK